MNNLAPIVLFTHRRLHILIKVVESLKENYLASKSDMIIYSDGFKNDEDYKIITEVRNYLKTISGFNSLKIIESTRQKGLSNSILQGVSEVLKTYSKVIVIEDDLLLAKNYLSYMNQALDFYQDKQSVLAISGYSPLNEKHRYKESYFTQRASSWGWGIWEDRWVDIDWKFSSYDEFIVDPIKRKEFNKMGSDMVSMIMKQKSGMIDSWAIRICFHQYINNMFSVHPMISKVKNIGFSDDFAAHTHVNDSRFDTTLDISNNQEFIFETNPHINKNIIKLFKNQNSILKRLLSYIFRVFISIKKNTPFNEKISR